MGRSTEFNKGAIYARDCIIAEIIGLQNYDIEGPDSKEYKAYQKLLEVIDSKYGHMYGYFGEPEPKYDEEEEEL